MKSSKHKIKKIVREGYARAANDPGFGGSGDCFTGFSDILEISTVSKKLGYTDDQIAFGLGHANFGRGCGKPIDQNRDGRLPVQQRRPTGGKGAECLTAASAGANDHSVIHKQIAAANGRGQQTSRIVAQIQDDRLILGLVQYLSQFIHRPFAKTLDSDV